MKPTEQAREEAKRYSLEFESHERDTARESLFDGYTKAISKMQPEWVAITSTSKMPLDGEYFVCTKKKKNVIRFNLELGMLPAYQALWRKRFSHYIEITIPQPPTK